MAYSDFILDRLTQEFGVDFQGGNLFAGAPPVEPSAWLTEALTMGQKLGFGGVKARSERLISPVLMELTCRNDFTFALVSGPMLDADPARGLTGPCDFVLSASRVPDFVQDAFCCVTVARSADTDPTHDRCAAQLLGAWQLNQRSRYCIPVLYGCHTTGTE